MMISIFKLENNRYRPKVENRPVTGLEEMIQLFLWYLFDQGIERHGANITEEMVNIYITKAKSKMDQEVEIELVRLDTDRDSVYITLNIITPYGSSEVTI